MKFSANLGFLWTELDLSSAIDAAAQSGFDAVECHWPYDMPAALVSETLRRNKIPMISLNTRPGDLDAGEFGLAAVESRQDQAQAFIDEAIAYANQIHCACIHVLAGRPTRQGATDQKVYLSNLRYACDQAAQWGITVLIEPVNHNDLPGYHLNTMEQAVDTLDAVGHSNLKIMADCYHLYITQGQVQQLITENLEHVHHIQFASVPERTEPDTGRLNYPVLIKSIYAAGYKGYFGAEYKPRQSTEQGLHWLHHFKSQ